MESDHKCAEALEQINDKCISCILEKELPLCSNCRQKIVLQKKDYCNRCMKNTLKFSQLKFDYFSDSISDEKIFKDLGKQFINIEKSNDKCQSAIEIPLEGNPDGLIPNYSDSKSLSMGCEIKTEGVMVEPEANEAKAIKDSSKDPRNTITFETNASKIAFSTKNSNGEGEVEESEFTN
jgi:hypothetical protein